MTDVPQISVVLPTYDRLQYLAEAIDSVLAQTFSDWELIVADDGSGAATQAFLDTLGGHPRIRTLRLTHSANPGAVRNRALREARGTVVAFIDSDDAWLPTKLEEQFTAMYAAGCQWSYTDFIWVNAAGESIDSRRSSTRQPYDGQVFDALLQRRAGIALPTVMAERALLERAGGFDQQQLLHEDYDLWLRLALLSPITLLQRPLTRVRKHDLHFSRGGTPLLLTRRRVLEKMRGLVTDPARQALLRDERTRLAAELAWSYAVARQPGAVVRTLADSAPYSWRSALWYSLGIRALLRSLLPSSIVSALRGPRPGQR